MRRPFGVQLLAALLAMYAMTGVFLAVAMVAGRDPRFGWAALALALPASAPLPTGDAPDAWKTAVTGAALFLAFLAAAALYLRRQVRASAP